VGSAVIDLRPHDLPVGIVGPAPAADRLSAAFGASAPGTFALTKYDSEASARKALDARRVDAYLSLQAPSPRLVVAGAEGDTEAAIITGAFSKALAASGATVAVATVDGFPAGDAHGLILFFVVVAVLVASVVAAAATWASARVPLWARVVAIALFGIGAGPAAMGGAVWLTGAYAGDGFWPAAAILTLTAAAVGAFAAGLARLLGPAGFGITGLFVVLLGLVSEGGPAGPRMLPDFYRAIGPWLPPGDAIEALRGALFFGGQGIAEPVATLLGWLVAGLALMVVGELARGRRVVDAA
jgi:hypothetical protein